MIIVGFFQYLQGKSTYNITIHQGNRDIIFNMLALEKEHLRSCLNFLFSYFEMYF